GGSGADRPAAPRVSLEIEGQAHLEDVVEPALDAAVVGELQAALLGEEPEPGGEPGEALREVAGEADARRERLLDEELVADRELVLDAARARGGAPGRERGGASTV